MSSSLERFQRQFVHIRPLLNQINWRAVPFTSEKAFVGAVFSKIAYLHLPEFELRHHTLAKIIPCLTYQELIAQRVPVDVTALLRTVDLVDVFVIPTRYAVAVGVNAPQVLFVALRGTRPLYISDWMIDFRATRITSFVGQHEIRLHTGFYLAIADCIEQIASEIRKRVGVTGAASTGAVAASQNACRHGSHTLSYVTGTKPVYIVGHSLGGALSALVYALSKHVFGTTRHFGRTFNADTNAHSSYSFGMPRYGAAEAVTELCSPFHIYNQRDLVPGVPLKWMGFRDAPDAYCAKNGGSLAMSAPQPQRFDWWLSRTYLARGVREHFVECYIRRLGVAAGVY
jgi:hypothetical protein